MSWSASAFSPAFSRGLFNPTAVKQETTLEQVPLGSTQAGISEGTVDQTIVGSSTGGGVEGTPGIVPENTSGPGAQSTPGNPLISPSPQ